MLFLPKKQDHYVIMATYEINEKIEMYWTNMELHVHVCAVIPSVTQNYQWIFSSNKVFSAKHIFIAKVHVQYFIFGIRYLHVDEY